MSFFYDLNKRLADLAKTQQQAEAKKAEPIVESAFSKLAKEIGKNPKVKNPAAVAATIGREKYGQKAMTKKSIAGKKAKHHEEMEEDFSPINEKFAEPAKINPEKKGMFTGKNKAELQKQYNKLKASGPHEKGSAAYTKMKELAFAIRAKSGWGKVSEEETDEGNAFTGKLKSTPKGGEFELDGKEYKDTSDLDEGYEEMHKWLADREKEKGTGKFDVKDTGYSKRYTRRHEEEPEDDDTDAPVSKGGAKKGRKTVGAGKGKKIGAKVRGTSKLHRQDAIAEEDMDEGWRGGLMGEPNLVKTRRSKAETAYREIADFLRSPQNGIEPRARQHLMRLVDELAQQATKTKEMPVAEKAPPGAKAERMVKHIKKGYAKDGKLTPKEKSIAYATAWKAHNKGQVEEEGGKPDFLDLDKDGNKKEPMKQAAKQAKTKGKDKEEVEETTTSGSVATATTNGKSSAGGMKFGKGVYESLDTKFKQALTESIQVQENLDECGMEGAEPGITIQASGEDAVKLMQLLKLAGLTGHEEELDENKPDWPGDPKVTGGDDPQLRRWSAGLNGPKSTGQSTTIGGGLPNLQARRQVSMEESVELERTLFNTWKNYKG